MLHQPGEAFEQTVLQVVVAQIVQRYRQLLIVGIAEIVVQMDVGLLFGGNHLAHQRYGGILLPAVAPLALRLYRHLVQFPVVRLQADGDLSRSGRTYVDDLRLIAHRAEGESPAIVACNAKLTVTIAFGSNMIALVHHTGVGHGATVTGIDHFTNNLRQHLSQCQEKREKKNCISLQNQSISSSAS